MDVSPGEVTTLLAQLTKGNQEAASKLVPLVYSEMRRLASRHMRRERTDHTLQTTALVHEAYLKLVQQRSVDWRSRAHFLGIAAQVMRRILIDHARGHLREKRGGGQQMLPLDEALVFSPRRSNELVKVDAALLELARQDPRQAKIVELRFFGGLTVEETAEILGISPKTVKRDWALAKAWLHGFLKQSDAHLSREMGSR
jgi:RNA polymerase sigma-70 factor, ECF subfamily